jgi:hypothetical protein
MTPDLAQGGGQPGDSRHRPANREPHNDARTVMQHHRTINRDTQLPSDSGGRVDTLHTSRQDRAIRTHRRQLDDSDA